MKENFAKMVNDLQTGKSDNNKKYQNYGLIHLDLLRILQKELQLSTELCLDELHMSEGFERHIYLNRKLQSHNQHHNLLENLGNIFVNIPWNTMGIQNHQRIHITEAILNSLDKSLKNDNPVRCLLTLPDNNNSKSFIDLAMGMGAKPFLEISKDQDSLIHHLAYKFEEPPKIRNKQNWIFLLLQNKYAETSIPFSYENFKLQIMDWCLKNKIQNYKLTPLTSSVLNGNYNLHSSSGQQCPIATFNRNVHSAKNLLKFTSKENARWIDQINQSVKDKSIFFSGFFLKIFYSMIKKYRPKSYKEDLHQIRFDLLEANSKVFEWERLLE